ncbi:related to HSV2-Phosphatidylinositol 3,5-bisphosphate-binding protein [Sporisorium reilianum f. sp. reilianum]|uniref:Related to HSV2-Phosphatidylinositol 3,5-bisphosphate-binding protein n=1 Tax=Sporisorium reilianum f. sp. reilianum TaxID=72559 RepID=A0A2N8ULL2_9BASI|nr:related to HSV2-Phosphatidylinositol 3,5-bisphosphate-binding protein [Sporisorium reilianum f. sp. reilianum]
MHLPRHTIESHAAVPLFRHASFCSPDPATLHNGFDPTSSPSPTADELAQPAVFTCATLNGFMVSQTDPLKLVSNRSWSSSQGGLSHAVPVQHTSLLFLVGGGRVPRFAPNKVILWDEAAEYTAKQSPGTSRGVDSDDDDDISSTTSRRASTIFSAGSEFDAYGKSPSHDFEHDAEGDQGMSRSSSSANDLRFSTSSLVDTNDLHDSQSHTDLTASTDSGAFAGALDKSFGASSLGIGRLQAAHTLEDDGRSGSDSMLPDDASSDLSGSFHSHAIMSSSANLADPFAQEDSRALEYASSSASRPVRNASSSSSSQAASSRRVQPSVAGQGLFSNPSSRHAGADLVDSVSSLATTATDATAKAPPQILHGREVTELEFSEVVRAIYATSVHARPTKQKAQASKGKARASLENGSTRKAKTSRFCVVLVVVLASRAVIFELSPPSTAQSLDGNPAGSNWRIQKRTAVQTYRNTKGLGSVAPYYGESAIPATDHASAIVALPGRQKGHVQLLSIKLQNLAASDAAVPNLSNPTLSVGAASIIVAHESSLAAITLSPNGLLLATASSKGTLIRIWSNNLYSGPESNAPTKEGAKSSTPGRTGFGARLLRELRRGTDPATILSVAFTPDASLVAAASDKGTIHIFLIDAPSTASQANVGSQSGSTQSSSSRTANLGRAAAQYLPSSLGSLAGQIPPSVLPQYLKSEWSSAQFRIPLKSFGASSRHYTAPSTTDDGALYGASAPTAKPAGTEKSTEGAWAQMRSRISDIRKGEASVEERIFLCWIVEPSASSAAPRGVGSDKDRSRTDKTRSRMPGDDASSADGERRRPQYRLIALTTSGGWYKLAVSLPQLDSEQVASGSTVLDMYRRDASSQSKRTNTLECQLLEFRPMAALLDGWRA